VPCRAASARLSARASRKVNIFIDLLPGSVSSQSTINMKVMTDLSSEPPRPPAPLPLDTPLGPIATMRVLHRNPIETWTKAHFELPIIVGPTILGRIAVVTGESGEHPIPLRVVSDPAAIRRVLVDNTANYRKDPLQKRVLGPGVSGGLLDVERDDWRVQRRTLAPLFIPRTVASFALAINAAAEDLIARWLRLREGRVVNMQPEMARVTLDVLGRTIFSDGLGRDFDQFVAAISGYLTTLGRLDPFDLLDFPDWVPRLTKLGTGSAETFFAWPSRQLSPNANASLPLTRGLPPGCPHTPSRSPGSANRRWLERYRSQSQYPDLYFGRA
jgi:Cytochrome P450